tara:strand:+ start:1559 stop:2011 length:453 start_codon:yes stop_codon:yes gene_type:complete
MPTLSNLPEVGLAMLGFPLFRAQDSASSRLFALKDHDQESIGQMVIVEQQGVYQDFLRAFFNTRSNQLVEVAPELLNQALEKQKMWVWSFHSAAKQRAFMPTLEKCTFGQVIMLGSAQSLWICLPSPTEWMQTAETKRRYWRDYQELFCT